MPLSLKTLIKGWIKPFGFEIVSSSRNGLHVFDDIKRYLININGPLQFFDVGANTGQTVAELLPNFKNCHIHAFEPTPEPFQALQKLALAHPSRVTPHQMALSNRSGTAKFFVDPFSVTNSLLESDANLAEYRASDPSASLSIEVTLQTADAFCSAHGIEQIHLLKSDTQGADLSVLQGAAQLLENNRVSVVLTEVLFTQFYRGQAHFEDIYRYLIERGFSFVNLYSVIHDKAGRAAWGDALFVNLEALHRLTKD
jgi:FkbM family methyltransferase